MASTVGEVMGKYFDNFTVGTFTVDSATAGTQRSFQALASSLDSNLISGEVYGCVRDSATNEPYLVLVGKCTPTLIPTIPVVNGQIKKTFRR